MSFFYKRQIVMSCYPALNRSLGFPGAAMDALSNRTAPYMFQESTVMKARLMKKNFPTCTAAIALMLLVSTVAPMAIEAHAIGAGKGVVAPGAWENEPVDDPDDPKDDKR